MALNGPLDKETRENLRLSHSASKVCPFEISVHLKMLLADFLNVCALESIIYDKRFTRKDD